MDTVSLLSRPFPSGALIIPLIDFFSSLIYLYQPKTSGTSFKMADALGLVASIIAIIQLTGQVGALSWGYIGGVRDAPRAIHELLDELSSFGKVLRIVLECAESKSGNPTVLEELGGKDGPLQKCAGELIRLRAKLEPKRGIKGVINALKWPLKADETSQYISGIERYKSLFNLALSADNMYVFFRPMWFKLC